MPKPRPTHCIQGHELPGLSESIGWRRCKICDRARTAARYQRRKLQAATGLSARVTRMFGKMDGLRWGSVRFTDGAKALFHYDRHTGQAPISDAPTSRGARPHRLTAAHQLAATLAIRAAVPPIEGVV